MRVRITLNNVGHMMSKLVELSEPPKVGDVVIIDRGRQRVVTRVDLEPGTGIYVASLTEDEYDLEIYRHPRIHIEHLNGMRQDGWDIEGEAALRAQLQSLIHQRSSEAPGSIDLAASVRSILDGFPADVVLRAIADRIESHARWVASEPNGAARAKALQKDAESIRVTGAQLSASGRSRVPVQEPSNKRRSS